MQCPSCGKETRQGAKYCRECGANLEVELKCVNCESPYEPGQRFCEECGQTLQPSDTSPEGLICSQCGKSNDSVATFCNGCATPLINTTTPESPRMESVSTADSTPTSFDNGRYSITRFLGEGGKKQVYLAQDTLLDRDVAFALIKTEATYSPKGLGHIFMSYVQEDSAVAIELASALEASGYSTWYYEGTG